jgi:hypothetical protein
LGDRLALEPLPDTWTSPPVDMLAFSDVGTERQKANNTRLANVARGERAARRYENARSGRRTHRDMVQARFDLGFGISLAHGYAVLGRKGFEGRFDYAAIGAKVRAAVELICELDPLAELRLKVSPPD